jgi:hypothetical protein
LDASRRLPGLARLSQPAAPGTTTPGGLAGKPAKTQ